MSITAPAVLRRELDELDLAVRLSPGVPAAALVERARALGRDARAVGLAEIAGVAVLREGELLLAQGDTAGAATAFHAAVEALEQTGTTDLLATATARLSDALVAGDAEPSEVIEVCSRGIALVERDRYRTSRPYLQAGYLTRTISLYANGVRAAAAAGDPRFLTWMELSKSRVLPGMPAPASATVSATTDQSPVATDGIPDLEARLATLSRTIDAYAGRGRDTAGLRQERRLLFDQLVAGHRKATPLPDPSLEGITAALEPGQLAISYYWLDGGSLLIAIVDRRGATTTIRPVTPADRAVLDRLSHAVLGEPGGRPSPDPAAIADAVTHLAPLVMPEPVAAAVRRARRLLVSPHRSLHVVPFAALALDGQPLIRHVSLATVPNLTCLQLPDPTPRPARMLAVGATDYAVPGHAAVSLVDATAEVAEIEASYRAHGVPVETLIDDEATEAALTERCGGEAGTEPTCLHLAVHGESVESDTPLESWLLLPRSRLDGIDLVQWRLPGATVVLSACCSGQRAVGARRLQELPGDDLLGLQTALFAAGARQVLGALWPVESQVARSLTTGFHRNLIAGAPADVALQQAVVDFLDTGDLVFRMSPYWWAPLFLSCVGRPRGLDDGVPR